MKQYWIKSGIYTLLTNGSMLVFGFLSFLALVRILPQKQFGIWVLYLTVITFAEIARNGITQNALVKFLAGGKVENYREIVTASLLINIFTGFVGLTIVFVVAPVLGRIWAAPELTRLLWLYSVYILFYIPLTFLQFLSMANLDFGTRFKSILTYQATNFGLIVGIYLLNGKLKVIQLPLIQAGAALAALIVTIFSAKKYIKLQRRINWQWVRKLFHFGKYVLATNFSSMLFNRMDTMMLGYFLNPVSVAIYNIPTRIGNYVEVPMNSLASIVFPQAAIKAREQTLDSVRYLYERSVGVILAMILPLAILIAIFAKEIVLLIAGEKYLAAVPILRLFALLTAIKPFGRQGGSILDSIGYPNYNFYTLLTSLVINFVLNWYFIIHYGIIGAVFGTMLAVLSGTIIQQFILVRLIKIKPYHPFIYIWATYRDAIKTVFNFVHKLNLNGRKVKLENDH